MYYISSLHSKLMLGCMESVVCSLLSKEVFDGTEGNLLRIFEKNRSILHRIKELPLDEPRPKER